MSPPLTSSEQAPGPRGYPIVGILPKLWRDPLRFLSETVREYGDMVCLRRNRLYLANHPDHVQHVLRDKRENYCKNIKRIQKGRVAAEYGGGTNGAGEKERRRTLGWQSVALSEGEDWRRQRTMVQPVFSHNQFGPLAEWVLGETKTLASRWKALADTSQVVDVHQEMLGLILRILVKSLFGNSLKSDEQIETIVKAVSDNHEFFDKRVGTRISIPESIPTSANRRFQNAFRTLTSFITSAIEERRRKSDNGNDVLGLLLSARDPKTGDELSQRQLEDELLMLSILGHKTTATALTWAFFLLGQSPPVELRLYNEAVNTLDNKIGAIAALPKLTYTRQVVDEALRIYPPTWVIGRVALNDDVLGGYQVPAGATVLLSPYLLHRHPSYWDAPDVFDPNRFAPTTSSANRRPAYLPFGDGERICMASHFALMQLCLVLAEITRSFHLEPAPGPPVEIQPRAVLSPRRGLNMLLQVRESSLLTNARSASARQ